MAGTMLAMRGGRCRPDRAVGSVLVIAVVVAACSGGSPAESSGSTSSTLPVQQLFGAQAQVLEDELWVFGGISGPEGIEAPRVW